MHIFSGVPDMLSAFVQVCVTVMHSKQVCTGNRDWSSRYSAFFFLFFYLQSLGNMIYVSAEET